jgi:acyl-CoA thioesterase
MSEAPPAASAAPAASGAALPAAVAQMMADDAASAALGIEVLECSPGRAVTRMLVRPDMANGYAIAHGGLVFAVADTAFACACNSHGEVTVAAGAEITFVAPARVGDILLAEAVERVTFGRSGIYDVTVRRGLDVIAEFRGRSHRLASQPEGMK